MSVLITGPNGAGKDKLADIIHANSALKNKAFIKVNVGALPMDLLEAELFGAEAGAFTGANKTRIGRFEVAVWKKVIRIISHELNNSVAPIASMVNSGRMITKDLNDPKLSMIFDTIEDRSHHLSQFISNYARFAKLPQPKKDKVDWRKLVDQLKQHYSFELQGQLPIEAGYFDLIQMEQVLLNLLKNAHESGSNIDEVSLSITSSQPLNKMNMTGTALDSKGQGIQGTLIEVKDKGAGMSADVLKQALLPFYSTKQSGTGLGLPLCREIIEAHDGRISLHNRDNVGLCVSVFLPESG